MRQRRRRKRKSGRAVQCVAARKSPLFGSEHEGAKRVKLNAWFTLVVLAQSTAVMTPSDWAEFWNGPAHSKIQLER